ncbi:MAG TPA: radical SAM protein, partial [Planctomycetota bacterium]|nr:radical SAM protein [Planctomycetota bacterium]
MGNWTAIAESVLSGKEFTRGEALAVLGSPDVDLLDLLGAAYKVRHHYHGNKVKLHVLENAMSGMCPEDCKFCSQSNIATGEIERYRLESKAEMVAAAKKAKAAGAYKYCIVTSTRGPSDPQLATICAAVKEIKDTVGIRVCTS